MTAVRQRRLVRMGLFAAASVAATLAGGFDASSSLDVMLTNLPQQQSSAYSQLYEAAGKPDREVLEMSKAEIWKIPSGQWEAFLVLAQKAGSNAQKLSPAANHLLLPMAESKGMSAAQSAVMHAAMDTKAAVGAAVMSVAPAAVSEHILSGGEIVIPLAGGFAVTAKRISLHKRDDGYAWHGVVTETGEPVTILWWATGRVAGSVTYRGHVYSVHELGGDMQAVIEMDPARMPQEHAPMPFNMMEKMHFAKDPLVTQGDPSALTGVRGAGAPKDGGTEKAVKEARDIPSASAGVIAPGPLDIIRVGSLPQVATPKAVIRLIVAYTKAAAAHYQDIKMDLIPLAIEDANESFRMSGIDNVELELAYAYETDYVESGSHFEHVFRFADKNDGYMDEVHALRDRYKADVGVLIVDDPHGCGLSAGVHVDADRAFTVVHHECAANMYSLAHEIGHIIGARHDKALDDSKEPFSFGHGYVSGKNWRTMMAYKDSCDGCPRVPVWSNPRVMIRGVPAGNAESDNARVISENAARVAAFR